MQRTLKGMLLATTIMAFAAGAQAQDIEELEARLDMLEAMVMSLQSDLDAERAKNADEIDRLETVVLTQPAATVSTPSGDGFMVADTNLNFGGFIDFDAHVTNLSDGAIGSSSVARDFYIPSVTPVGGSDTTETDFTAQGSRFWLNAGRDVGGKKLTARIEMDFLGSAQGDERVSSSYSPRLRRAYLDFNGWRVGQEWSTFQNTSAIPESASFLVLSDGMIFDRQALVRYTNGNWQFAAENGNATVTVNGARMEADSNLLPDLVARYNFTGDYGNISVAAIGRQLRLEMPGMEETTTGFGLSVSGRVKVGDGGDDIRFNLAGGEGLGRYIGLNAANGAALDPLTGDLEAIPSYGGYVAWRHPFGETARFSVGYSGLFVDNPDFTLSSSTKSVQSAYGAVLWDVAPKLTMGVELMYGVRELENGSDGAITRATVSTKYSF